MGQALACCSKSDVDSNDIKTQGYQYLADRFTHPNTIYIIVRIQAAFRCYMAMKYVKRVREHQYQQFPNSYNNVNSDVPFNYENPDVIVIITYFNQINQHIREQLGDFDFAEEAQGIGKRREMRNLT